MDSITFSNQMEKCLQIIGFEFGGQDIDDGKIENVDCESESGKCMVFKSNLPGTLSY